jgi:FtsP/CotA-like multicopper oxidase with cupredoxin domain
MRRGRRGLGVALGVVALAAGFALTSCGSDDEAGGTTETTTAQTTTQTTTDTQTTTQPPPIPKPTEVRVRVVGGAPQGGIVRKSVDQGDRVVVIVTSDVSDHVHVHGYDLFGDVAPGKRVRIAFRARIPGRFVIELEDRHAQIAELTVTP